MPARRIKNKKQSDDKPASRIDLKDILNTVGDRVIKSRWRCRDLWVLANFDENPDSYRFSRLKVSGDELLEMASKIYQTIDGRFEARSEGAAKTPWLVIVAFDSSWFEVWSSKLWIIEKIKTTFQDTTDITEISGILSEPVKAG
ncbi:MAG TPA: hypothetical protein VIL74_05805 [Pyrinomonadaceae bacterium]|jgi:hypothetical protein